MKAKCIKLLLKVILLIFFIDTKELNLDRLISLLFLGLSVIAVQLYKVIEGLQLLKGKWPMNPENLVFRVVIQPLRSLHVKLDLRAQSMLLLSLL